MPNAAPVTGSLPILESGAGWESGAQTLDLNAALTLVQHEAERREQRRERSKPRG